MEDKIRKIDRLLAKFPGRMSESYAEKHLHSLRAHFKILPPGKFTHDVLKISNATRRLLLAELDVSRSLAAHANGYAASYGSSFSRDYVLGAPTNGGFQQESAGGFFHQPETRILSGKPMQRAEVCVFGSTAATADALRKRRKQGASARGVASAFVREVSPPLASKTWKSRLASSHSSVESAAAELGITLKDETGENRRITAFRGNARVGFIEMSSPDVKRVTFFTSETGLSTGFPVTSEGERVAFVSKNDFHLDNPMGRAMQLSLSKGAQSPAVKMLLVCAAMRECAQMSIRTVLCKADVSLDRVDSLSAAFWSLGPKFARVFPASRLSVHRAALLFGADPLFQTHGRVPDGLMMRPVPTAAQLASLVAGISFFDSQFALLQ